jgi:DNA polymerase III epsilon subunit-like protein
MDYVLYVTDVETTGLNSHIHDIIELSLLRISDGEQKTWWLKPLNPDHVEAAALRINGHKLEDITHQTIEGRNKYQDPNKIIVEIENFMMEDGVPAEQRVMLGQNVGFDRERLEQLWNKCNSKDSFPFGRRTMDTMIWAFMMDYVQRTLSPSYSLSSLIKKYGIKNSAAHTAAADVMATKELFEAQVAELRSKLGIK